MYKVLGMVPGMLSEWGLPLSGILWDVHMLHSSHCLWLLRRSLSSYSFARSSSHAEYAFPLSSTLILPGRHQLSLYDSSPTIPSLWSPPWWFSSQEMVGMFPQSSICITQLYHLAYHDPGVCFYVYLCTRLKELIFIHLLLTVFSTFIDKWICASTTKLPYVRSIWTAHKIILFSWYASVQLHKYVLECVAS